MKILIGADIVPTASNQSVFEDGAIERIVDADLIEIFKNSDYRILNLEVPLTDKETPISKCGPNLIASVKSAAGIKQLDVDFLTLANNHILDQGEQGLKSTALTLDSLGIAYAGIGKNPEEASRPHIFELDGRKIGVYCCAEHEFSIVSGKNAGANPFDPLESLDHIASLKDSCDYVICLYHGGKEHYRYPSPSLQKTCRKIVEKGADIVICQHTHCVGCEEKWQNGTIVYGQGNFLFDHSKSEFWQTSLLLQIDADSKNIEYIPIRKNGNGVRKAVGEDAEGILSDFRLRSEEILRPDFIEKAYSDFAKSMIGGYIRVGDSISKSFLFRVINKLSGHRLMPWYEKRKISNIRYNMINFLECEAHRELFICGLENCDLK